MVTIKTSDSFGKKQQRGENPSPHPGKLSGQVKRPAAIVESKK